MGLHMFPTRTAQIYKKGGNVLHRLIEENPQRALRLSLHVYYAYCRAVCQVGCDVPNPQVGFLRMALNAAITRFPANEDFHPSGVIAESCESRNKEYP